MNKGIFASIAIAISLLFSSTIMAADKPLPQQTLFKNVNVFNGTDNKLYENHSVLVEGNTIKAISDKTIKTNSNQFPGQLMSSNRFKGAKSHLITCDKYCIQFRMRC